MIPLRRLKALLPLAALAAGASYALHLGFGRTGPLALTAPLLLILLAHGVFVHEVARAGERRTAAGQWTGLLYFAAFLGVLIAAYGYIFALVGLNDGGKCAGLSHDLATGVFFSVITWTTVGYGDVIAGEPLARLFAAAEALNGYLVLALFIAALVPVFQGLLKANGRD